MIDNKITISIVTYNSKDIFKTLDGLTKEILPNFPCKMMIFDNHSSEEFKKKLEKYESDQVKINFYNENKGFGFGHNYNAKNCDTEYFLICNPDILVDEKNFAILWEYLQKNNNLMLAPKVVYPNGEMQYLVRRRLAVFDYILRFIPFNFVKKLFNKRLSYFECRDLTEEIQEIQFASGCFMFTRTKDFLEVGGFDERFFMYFEDNDLCQKYRQSGKEIIYNPQAKVIHFYGKEAHKSSKVFKIFLNSMRQYFNKWGWKFF